MKKLIAFIFLLSAGLLTAQNDGFNYKAVVTENGQILANHTVKLNVDFYENGSVVYQEHHETTTDENGIFQIYLGEGTPTSGQFSDLDWSVENHSYKVYLSTDGGSTYHDMGMQDFKTVPYAKYAETGGVQALDDLEDARARSSSVFIGAFAGENNDDTDNKNAALGYYAMNENTSGVSNTAMGYYALRYNTTGNSNVAIGSKALKLNQTGYQNTAVGTNALYYTTGNYNTGLGTSALYNNTTGMHNIGMGVNALFNNTTGSGNLASGNSALLNNTTGSYNIAVGKSVMYNNSTGDNNIAIGTRALYRNTEISRLIAIGDSALFHNGEGATSSLEGTSNIGIGYKSLFYNNTGYANTAVGSRTMMNNTTGTRNTVIGTRTLSQNTSGYRNTAAGYLTMMRNETGYNNTAFGTGALYANTSGDQNTAVGANAFASGTDFNNSTAIGYDADITASNQVRLGNSSVISIGGYAAWTNLSDGRFKTDIMENVPGMALIEKLRPVTYRLNMDALAKWHHTPDNLRIKDAEAEKEAELQIGFIAQEVEQAAKEVGFDFHAVDKPKNQQDTYGLRYSEFVPVLVKALQEQQETIKKLEARVEALEKKLQPAGR